MRDGTLFQSLLQQRRIPPRGVTCPAPLGVSKTQNKNKGFGWASGLTVAAVPVEGLGLSSRRCAPAECGHAGSGMKLGL